MSDDALLPRRLTLMGEALRPVWRELTLALAAPAAANLPLLDMLASVQQHLAVLESAVQRQTERVNDLMRDVVANEAAGEREVLRAVARFEATLQDMLAGYRNVQALAASGSDAEARDLLAGVYRHSLAEVRDWLHELVETLADPLAALQRRGLPTSGEVILPLTLEFTAAPGLNALTRWIKSRAGDNVPATRKTGGLGFLGTVGAVALGWGIAEALFGDNDGEN